MQIQILRRFFPHRRCLAHTCRHNVWKRNHTILYVSHETHIHLYKSRKVCWICDFKAKSEKGIVIGWLGLVPSPWGCERHVIQPLAEL